MSWWKACVLISFLNNLQWKLDAKGLALEWSSIDDESWSKNRENRENGNRRWLERLDCPSSGDVYCQPGGIDEERKIIKKWNVNFIVPHLLFTPDAQSGVLCAGLGCQHNKANGTGPEEAKIRGLKHHSWEGRQRELGLCSLERRMVWGDFIVAF